MNYRWKFGAGKWKWPRQLHKVHDASGDRLCGLVNGSVVGGVLPAAQFCNTLTHSVLSLWRVHGVQPFVVHATWMRQQREAFKLMRLREAELWRDPPTGLLTYDDEMPTALLAVPPIARGALPLHH